MPARPLDERPQIVTTKIATPQHSASLIERPRLFALLESTPAKALTILVAPPGYGKTSLTVSWTGRLRRGGSLVAWLTVDANDDEPTRFLFMVCQALQRACSRLGSQQLLEPSMLAPHAVMSALINELTEIDQEIYLFIDDYHLLAHPEIHEALTFLIKYSPPQVHLVLLSRTKPPLPLSELRTKNELLELDAVALRFDPEELERFLEQEKLGPLSPSELGALFRKTEGWPAILRIIASSAREHGNGRSYLTTISSASRPISDCFSEILNGLPAQMYRFMVRSAILTSLTASLCQAVTGARSSRALLETIAARRLLVAPVDQKAEWYRCHPLLGEYLLTRLQTERPDEVPELHRRAARWYASHGYWTEAIEHATAAGNRPQALRWINKCAMALVKQGDLLTVLAWLHRFPTELMRGQIQLRLAIAWGLALAIRFDDCLALLTDIEKDIDDEQMDRARFLETECQIIRAVAIALKDDTATALGLAEDCLLLPTDDPSIRNVASNVALFGYWKAGNLTRASAMPWIPYSDAEDRRYALSSVYRRCLKGSMEFDQLQIESAERCYFEAVHLAERYVGPNSAAAALPSGLIAQIRCEQGHLDSAEAAVLGNMAVIRAVGMLENVLSAYSVLVRVALSKRNLAYAYALLEEAEDLGASRGWARLSSAMRLETLRINLYEGKLAEAEACLERLIDLAAQYPVSAPCAWSDIQRAKQLGIARVAVAKKGWQEAIDILQRMQVEARSVHNLYLAHRIGIQVSVILLNAGRTEQAIVAFREQLAAAAATGLFQSVVDEGGEIGSLLELFREDERSRGRSEELLPFADRLLARWTEIYGERPTPVLPPSVETSLSPREFIVLEFIADGRSNKEIAQALGIAPETVKSHVSKIYAKLSVDKRAQAVSLAHSLGLLSKPRRPIRQLGS